MTSSKKQFFLLTGDPGVGKTTLTKKLVSLLSEKGLWVSGFYTEETRKNGVREGFDVVSLEGSRARLARDQNLLAGPVKYKVGKYGVLVQEFEGIALPCLEKQDDSQSVLVIDEIGKMEFFSESFKSRIRDIFSAKSDSVVLATIPIRKTDSLIENIRNHDKAKVWMITQQNRNNIHQEILQEMNTIINLNKI